MLEAIPRENRLTYIWEIDTVYSSEIEVVDKFYSQVYSITESHELSEYLTAQSMLETGWGKSKLTSSLNNWFGIKGKGKSYKTKEFINNRMVTISSSFKQFESLEDCINYRLELDKRLKRSGKKYATDPNYDLKIQMIKSKLRLSCRDTIKHKPI